MTETIVAIQNLAFQYESAGGPVLKDINLTVKAGELLLLMGPAGCGKSTLLLCLNGIIPKRLPGQFRGQVTVAGLDVAQHEVYELAEKVGLVFQDPEAQFSTLYVEDEVAFGLENLRYPRPEIQKRVKQALQQVGLAGKIGVRLDRLSGGEKQKVALASILAMEPDLLVFDTPTANLDPVSARDFFALLRRLKQELGKTMIIVEQQVDDLIDLVDRLVLLNAQGQIVGNGPPDEMLATMGMAGLAPYGPWLPQIWELADAAYRQGAPLSGYPLTLEEAYTTLAPIFNGHRSPVVKNGGKPKPAEGPAILQVQGLSHRYPAAPAGVVALQNVHLTIAAGDFCAIAGQNGAGKTTLAKYLTKILKPPPDTVFLNKVDLATQSLFEVTRHIGYVFQNPEHQFVADTVYDELAYSLRVRGVDETAIRARVQETLATFRLSSLAWRHPFALSQGEKRLLSVAAMLIVEPEVLILDEPTLGLDRAMALALMSALQALNEQGKTIIFITHDMRLVAEYAHSAVVMAAGSIIFRGTVHQLFDRPDVMASALLLAPPVATLARQIRQANPAFPPLISLREFRQLLEVI